MPDRHRKFVRSACYRPLADGPGFGTMVRSERFKQVACPGHGIGELLDLAADPGEFEKDRWEDRRMVTNFMALALASDMGRPRV